MKRYVLGFVFDFGYHNTLLLLRTKEDWQLGRMNGIGGKIEKGETPAMAMEREWIEETNGFGLQHPLVPFGRLHGTNGDGWEVHLFHGKTSEFPLRLHAADSAGEGCLQIVPLDQSANTAVLPNLRYLIPMAKNHARGMDAAKFFDIAETDVPT